MTTSIFSKLSQQSKHRDLLEKPNPDEPPIGNPKTGKTIADFYAMGLHILMVCNSCHTRGPLDFSALPNGQHTESRIITARCPACGSDSVSQEIISTPVLSGPPFIAFIRVPRTTPSRSSQRHTLTHDDILTSDDLPTDLLPVLVSDDIEPESMDNDSPIEDPHHTPSQRQTQTTSPRKSASLPRKAPSTTPPPTPQKKSQKQKPTPSKKQTSAANRDTTTLQQRKRAISSNKQTSTASMSVKTHPQYTTSSTKRSSKTLEQSSHKSPRQQNKDPATSSAQESSQSPSRSTTKIAPTVKTAATPRSSTSKTRSSPKPSRSKTQSSTAVPRASSRTPSVKKSTSRLSLKERKP